MGGGLPPSKASLVPTPFNPTNHHLIFTRLIVKSRSASGGITQVLPPDGSGRQPAPLDPYARAAGTRIRLVPPTAMGGIESPPNNARSQALITSPVPTPNVKNLAESNLKNEDRQRKAAQGHRKVKGPPPHSTGWGKISSGDKVGRENVGRRNTSTHLQFWCRAIRHGKFQHPQPLVPCGQSVL